MTSKIVKTGKIIKLINIADSNIRSISNNKTLILMRTDLIITPIILEK